MSEIQVGNLDDVRISGFDLSVTLPDGTVELIPGGVTELLKGDLTIVSGTGAVLSRSEILSNVNLQGQAAVLVPELLTSGTKQPAGGDAETISKLTKEAEASQEAIEAMRNQIEELKKIKEKMEKEEKEQEEKEEQVESDSQLVEELIQQLDQTLATLALEGSEAVEAAKSPGKMQEELPDISGEDKRSNATPNANIGMGTSSSSAAARPLLEGEPEEQSDLFVELALSSRSDTGGKGDFITSVAKPTLEATTLPGAKVTITLNGVDYQVTADSNGKAIIIIEEALEDGEYPITVKAVDEDGNTVDISQNLVIDTVAPEATFTLATDTGSSDSDNLTNSNQPTFTGRISGDPAEVTLTVGDQSYNLVAKNGEYSFTLPVALPDGDYEFILTVADEAGNETVLKQPVTIDTVNEFEVTLSDLTDSGVADDWITNVELPVFRMAHEPGTVIEVVINGEVHLIDTGAGSPTLFQPLSPLAEGTHNIEFIATDMAGNRVVVEKTLVIDTTPPAFEFLGMATDSDTGTVADNLTNINTPTFIGRGEVGATVHLEIDGVVYKSTVGNNGRWSLTVEHALPDGTYVIAAYAEDVAGNRSDTVASKVTIDTVGADITGGLDATSDSGLSTSDGITNTQDLVFSGKTEANIQVTLSIAALGITETVMSGEDGTFSFTTTDPSPVPEGTYEFTISATDTAGNVSEKPAAGVVVVDRQVSGFTASLSAESDTGVDDSDNLTSAAKPTLTGTGEPGSVVNIAITNAAGPVGEYGPVTVGANGQWQYTLPEALADDSYSFNFSITDLAGNTAAIALPITIDTTITLSAEMSGVADDGLTNGDTPGFTGESDPGVTVTLVLQHETLRQSLTLDGKAGSDGSWSISVPERDALTAQGGWTWSVSAVDAAGNRADPVTGSFVLDTVPPEVELSLVSPTGARDDLTNDPDLDLSIRTEAGAKVSVTVFRVEEGVPSAKPAYETATPAVVPAGGQLFYTIPELPDGNYIYRVAVTDVAGNTTDVPQRSITIDTVAPELGSVALTEASDSSTVGDNITNIPDLTFQGSGTEVGSTIRVSALNKVTGEVVTLVPDSFVANASNWVYSVPAELEDGTYTFTFTAEDAAGNLSPVQSISVQVDTTAPPLGAVSLQSGSDTGSSDSDFITNDTSPVFSGSSTLGDTVTIAIYRGDVLIKTGSTLVTNEDGTWNVQVSDLSDGHYHWVVTARDAAGNQSRLDTPGQTLTIDTVYTGATGKLDDSSNTGSVTDNITSSQEVMVSGTGEPGSRVTLKSLSGPDGNPIDVSSVTESTVAANGQWHLDLPFLGAGDGGYHWVVTLTDIAGNTRDVGGTIQLDTTATVTGELESDSGVSTSDNITSDSTPTFTGTGEVGGTIRLLVTAPDKTQVDGIPTAVVGKDGTWRITLPEALTDGEYQWKAEITDVAGNVQTTEDMTFVLDTTAPVIINAQLDSPVGYPSDIPSIQDTTPTFSGKSSESNCTVRVHIYNVTDGVVSGMPYYSSAAVTANAAGEFTISVNSPLPQGEYRWALEVSDFAGNRAYSGQQSMLIDTTAPTVTHVGLTSDTDTGLASSDGVTNDTRPAFTGRCEPGVRISIELRDADGQPVLLKPDYVLVGNDGSWHYTPEDPLPDGTYTWLASAMDAAGNVGTSTVTNLTIDTQPPPLTSVQLDAASDTGALHDDGITRDNTPTFSGTAEKGCRIVLELFAGSDTPAHTVQTMVTADNGSWSITLSDAIADGTYQWRVTATDVAGNDTVYDSEQNLVVDTRVTDFTAAMEAESDTGVLDSDSITRAGQVTIAGTAEPGAKVVLTSLVNTSTGEAIALSGEAITVSASGHWSITTPGLGADGLYQWTVQVTDVAGNTDTRSAQFTLDRTIAVTGTLDAGSDSGDSSSDSITNVRTPTISGTGHDGDQITVQLTGPDGFVKTLSTTVVSGQWHVNFADANALGADGQYRWTVTASDVAGNTATDNGSFTLDTMAPSVTAELTNDTGLATDDAITKNNQLSVHTQLSGNAHSVQLLVWREGGSASSPAFNQTFTLDTGTTEHTFTTTVLTDGNYQYKAIVMDVAGNTSESPTRQVTIDTTPPELGEVIQEGTSNGTYVNDASVSFNGTAEPGARIYMVLTKGSETIPVKPVYVEADALGSWNYTLQPLVASTLKDGTYQWSFLAVDQAGNISPAHNGQFTLDTQKPEVTFSGLTSETDSGELRDDLLTNAERPVFCGTVNENAFVTVTLASPGKTYTFTTTAGVNGNWELAATQDLQEGTYTISVTATDLAGNLSSAVGHGTPLEIDRTITGGDAGDFGLAADTDSGTSSSDDITNKTNPKLSGTVEAGTNVTLKTLTGPDGATVVGFTPVNTTATDGNWTLSLPTIGPLNGTYSYQLEYSDAAGNTKSVDGSFTFDSTIDLTAQFDSQTGSDDGVVYSNNTTPVLSGTGNAGDRITVVLDGPEGQQTLNTTVTAEGTWTVTADALSPDGVYNWTVTARDIAGNEKEAVGSFTLDTTPPTAEVTLDNDTGVSGDDGITNQGALQLSVDTVGASSIRLVIWKAGAPDAYLFDQSATPDGSGNATFTSPVLGDGTYEYQVTVTDVAGNSARTTPERVIIDTVLPDIGANITIDDVQNSEYVNAQGVTFNGTGEAGARIFLTLTDDSGRPVTGITPASVQVNAHGNWTYTLTNTLDDGNYTWSFVAEDAAGNRSAPVSGSVVMDTAGPTVDFTGFGDSDSGSSSTDGITNDQTPLFTGTVSEPAKITVKLVGTDGQSYTFLSSDYVTGPWSITASEIVADGTYTVQVTATDKAGNISPVDTASLVIDTAVSGGDPGSFGLADDSDSGVANDNITNKTAISLTGTVEAGAQVMLARLSGPGGAISLSGIVPTIAAADGAWTIALPNNLPEGTYSYTLRYVDVAGNEKEVNGGLTVDRSIEVTAVFGSETGTDGGIIYSNDTTPTFSGTGTGGDRVTLTLTSPGGASVQEQVTVGDNGTWTITVPTLSADGAYQWSITAVDAAGNTQAPITGAFTLDTQEPVLSAVGLSPASDTGFASNDGITSDTTPEFVITGEAGSEAVLRVWHGNSIGDTPVWFSIPVEIPPSGHVTIPATSAFANGSYTWTVTLTDVAGNETVSTPQSLTIDILAPTTPTLDLVSDSGTSTMDNLTNDNTPLFQGTGEPGTRVSLIITNAAGVTQTVQPAYVSVGNDGNWNYQLASTLGDGTYSVVSRAMDAAGNIAESTALSVTIDTIAPTLYNVRMASSSDSADDSDAITNVKNPVFEGRSEAGASITMVISQNGIPVHTLTTTASNSGNWNINNVPNLSDGSYSWQVTAKDAAGNVSPASSGDFTVDTAISQFTVQLASASDTGLASNDAITNQKNVQLSGHGENGATVTLTALSHNGVAIDVSAVTATTVAGGLWTLTLPTLSLGDGSYSYTVKIVDIAGNEEPLTQTLTLDTTKPVLTASMDSASDLGTSSSDGITKDTTPTISGTVSEGCRITLYIKQGGSTIATYGPVTSSGSWSITVDNPLANGSYTWEAKAEDVAGNVATVGNALTVDIQPPTLTFGLSSESDTGESQSDSITKSNNLTFSGNVSGEGSSAVKLRLTFGPSGGAQTTQNKEVNGGETFNFSVNAPTDGNYSWSLTATDVAGNEATKTGRVTVDTTLQAFSADTGLVSGSDTGIADDDRSNDKTPTFSGRTEAGATVILTMTFAGSQVVRTEAEANSSGNFTITVPSSAQLAPDGQYQWRLEAIDAAGNSQVKEGTYQLDTTPPAITFGLASDSGSSPSDWITNVKPVVINGTSNDSANVVVTLLSGSTVVDTETITPSGGSWSYRYDGALADGSYTFRVQSTDAAGNEFRDNKNLVIDTVVMNTFRLTTDTGVANDQITNTEYLQFNGTTDRDATVTLTVRNSSGATIHTYNPTVNTASGQWSFQLPTKLPEGSYTFTVTATDAAGNTDTSDPYQVQIDRTPPTLGGIGIETTDDSGALGDWITETRQVTITGTVSAGSSVEIVISGVDSVINATVNADGRFLAELPKLEYGEYQLTILATDVAGNVTDVERKLTITPDEVPFQAGLAAESDSGLAGDNVTNVTSPTLAGEATPGYRVEATINGKTLSTTVDLRGSWSIALPGPLNDGSYNVAFTVKDTAGNTQDTSSYSFTVDTSVATTIRLDPGSDSGEKGDFITNSNNVYITGMSEPGVTMEIRNKDTGELISEFVTTGNSWGYLLTGLGEGKHNFVVSMTDRAGNEANEEFSVTIDRTKPELSVQINGDADVGSVVSNELQQVFSGTVKGATSLVLTVNGHDYSVDVNADGTWSHTLDLHQGINNFSVKASDVAGNHTVVQGSINIKTQINFQMSLQNDDGPYSSDKILSGDKLIFGGRSGAGDIIQLVLSNSAGTEVGRTTITVPSSGEWSHQFTGLPDGQYSVTANVSDDAGNTLTRTIDTIVIDNTNVGFTANLMDADGVEGDNIVKENRPTFSGNGEVNGEVTLTIGGHVYNTQISSSGTWQFRLPDALADGQHTITIYSTDLAGNKSPTQTIEFTTDTVAPTLTCTLQGVVDNDGVQYINASQSNVVFEGTVSEAGTLTISINNQEFTKTLTAGGNWSIDVGNIVEREHAYTVTFTDVAGNEETEAGTVVVDRTINAYVTLLDSYDSITPDHDQNLDGITNSRTLRFGFNRGGYHTDTGLTAKVVVTGPDGFNQTYESINTDAEWVLPVTLETDGKYTFNWTFTDAAGNTTQKTQEIQLDTHVSDVDIGDLSYHGADMVAGETLTVGDTLISMSYTPPAGEYQKVQIEVNGTSYDARLIGNEWRFVGIPLELGENVLTLKAWDIAGNMSSATQDVLVKTGFTTLEMSIDGEAVADLQNIADVYSNDPQRTIALSGQVDAGSKIRIVVDGVTVTPPPAVDSQGNWHCTLNLDEGNNKIVIRFTDTAGNEEVINFNTVIDTIAPILTVDEVSGEGYQLINGDAYVRGTSVHLSGRVDAGSTVQSVTVNGTAVALATLVIGEGAWSLEIDGLQEGNNTIVINSQDEAGNVSSETLAIHRDSVVADFTVAATEGDNQVPDFSGTVEPGAAVKVTITNDDTGRQTAIDANVNADGTWHATTADQDFTDGNYSYVVEATDVAGNTARQGGQFTFDDIVTDLTAGLADADGDGLINHEPSFSGTVEPGSTVTVTLTPAGADTETITIKAVVTGGNWTASATGLTDGDYHWHVTATDAAGNSASTEPASFTLDTTPPSLTGNLADAGADGVVTEAPLFTGTVEPGSTVTVMITGAGDQIMPLNASVDASGKWTASATELPDGDYNWSVVATDAAGNSNDMVGTGFTLDTKVTGFTSTLADVSTDGGINAEPSFTGTVEPGSTVTVTLSPAGADTEEIHLTAVVTGNKWTASATDLLDGEYLWSVTATDAAGNSFTTEPASFTLDTAQADLNGTLMDASTDGTVTDVPVFTGAADPGADVLVELVHQDTGEKITLPTVSDADGHWSATAEGLSDGSYNWSMSATDAAGNNNIAAGGEFAFSATNIAPPSPTLSLVSDTPDEPLLETRVFTGESAADSMVTLAIAGKIYETEADDEGDWMIKAEFDRSGIFNYQLQYQDVHGEPVTEQGITSVKMVNFDSLDSLHNDQVTGSSAASDSAARHVAAAEIAPPSVDQFNIEHDQESF